MAYTVLPFFNQNVARIEKSDPVKLQAVESACTCVQVGCQTVAMTTPQVLCKSCFSQKYTAPC